MAIVTLLSDIGIKDYIVAAIKGQLLQINPEFNLVDVSHEVSSFNYPQAAYLANSAISNFPKNTVHIVLINVFDQRKDHILFVRHHGHYIGIADNGLIKMITNETPKEVVFLPWTEDKTIINFSLIIGKAYNRILEGESFESVGETAREFEEKNALKPMYNPNFMEGHIIFIDNFENVVVNITREEFEQQRAGRSFKIYFTRGEVIDKISETYASVPESEKLATFNSAGYLEIAINKGNAAGLFGLTGFVESASKFAQSRLLYQTVRIMFE